MSQGAEKTDHCIEINDLPPEEALTPEEKERLAGAGRYRPTFEALEPRLMMDAGIGAALPLTGGSSYAPSGQMQILDGSLVAPTTNEAIKYHGASDASGALPVANGDYMFVADDKSPFVIRLFDAKNGGTAVSSFKIEGKGIPTWGVWDLEGVTRNGNMAYWTTSGGKGNDLIFATKIIENGKDSTLEFAGCFTGMRDTIAAWGKAHPEVLVTSMNHPGTYLTLDAAQAKAAEGKGDKSWYNIEGIVVGPDPATGNTVAYIAFRAPLVAVKDANGNIIRQDALLLRVSNFTQLFPDANGNPATATTAIIDGAVHLNLAGGLDNPPGSTPTRGIRDIVYHEEWGRYVILGGNSGDGTSAQLSTLLYVWDGRYDAQGQGTVYNLSERGMKDSEKRDLSFEAIGQITGSLTDGTASVHLIADEGSSTDHGKEDANHKEIPWANRYFQGLYYSVPKKLSDAATATP